MTASGPDTPEYTPVRIGRRISLVEVLIGLTLLAVGIVWLLQSLDVVSVSWYAVLAAVLVAVGVALVVGSASGEQGGLIAIGVILTIALAATSWADLRFEGGVGDRVVTPVTIEELNPPYRHTAGPMTLDLSQLDFPAGDTTIEARVGAGELIVIVPVDVAVSVDWRVVAGNVTIFGTEQSGVFLDETTTEAGHAEAERRLKLDLIVMAGTIEVRR